ncbi:MAG: AMIN domain-containing protein, partial [Synechococcales cyanobacterium RM1_1_8]|nr:AMIN domain-containing protein [Synechococcales cyanobacterium RM1_1_8]
MKPFLGFGSIVTASAIVVMAAQPSVAAPTEVTGVTVEQTSGGITLSLKTRFGDRPQVFSAPRGNSWVADVINSQLSLPNGESFRQENPAPGIASVQIVPLDANSIRVIVTGTDTLPAGQVASRTNQMLSFSISTDSGVAVQPGGAVTQQPRSPQQSTAPARP